MSNLEYINQARKLLTEDYKTKHANEYNNWLARQQHSWQQPHTIVPYPPFVVSAALAPFKASMSEPSEDAVVAKALELYNQFNPTSVKNIETVVEQPIVEPIVEQIIVEDPVVEPIVEQIIVEDPVVEEPAVELAVAAITTPADAIYKIFQQTEVEAPADISATEPMPTTIEQALNVVPQPAEELAKIANAGRILPTVLQRMRDMASMRSETGEHNV